MEKIMKIKKFKDFMDEEWNNYRKKLDFWKENFPKEAICPYRQPTGEDVLVKMLDYLAEEIEKLKDEK